MNRTLRIVERARADVDSIFEWLTHRTVKGAITWYLAFRQAIVSVALSPEAFAVATESHSLNRPIRQATFKTRRGRLYRIVFELTESEIIILRVRGPGQSPLRERDLSDK